MLKKTKAKQHDDDALKTRFGAIVRAMRQRLAISQEELAWRADIHRTYLADIERGQRNISLTRIVKLVRALGVSMAEFFYALEEYFQSPIENPPFATEKSFTRSQAVRKWPASKPRKAAAASGADRSRARANSGPARSRDLPVAPRGEA